MLAQNAATLIADVFHRCFEVLWQQLTDFIAHSLCKMGTLAFRGNRDHQRTSAHDGGVVKIAKRWHIDHIWRG